MGKEERQRRVMAEREGPISVQDVKTEGGGPVMSVGR